MLAGTILACGLYASPADAQKTGTLNPSPSPNALVVTGSAIPSLYGREMNDDQRREFAALVFDPSLSSGLRSSSWTATIDASQADKEGKIQANLCDVVPNCGGSALHLTISGPLTANSDFTELADLDGLRGSVRAELGGAYNLANAAGAPSFTARLGLARHQFSYRDPATLAEASQDRTGTSFSLGAALKGVNVAGSFAYRRESSYRSADEQQVCVPATFGPAGTTTCSTVVVGGPAHSTKDVLEGEVRASWRATGAIRLHVAHDFSSSATGVDLPVYVIPDVSGNLAGGVRLGYRTDTKRWSAAMFVGAFKL
jgi:hypothetical protein